MALIKCLECGQDISDQAKTCPHCGYSLEIKDEKPLVSEAAATSAAMTDTPSAKHKKRKGGIIAAITVFSVVVIAIIVGVAIFVAKPANSATIIPYGLSWGDTYEKLKKADPEASGITKNEAGNYLSGSYIDSSYLGLKDENVILWASWEFKNGKALESVLIGVSPGKNCSMTTQEIFDQSVEHFSKVFGSAPVMPVSLIFDKMWEKDNYRLQLMHMPGSFVTISIEPVK